MQKRLLESSISHHLQNFTCFIYDMLGSPQDLKCITIRQSHGNNEHRVEIKWKEELGNSGPATVIDEELVTSPSDVSLVSIERGQ